MSEYEYPPPGLVLMRLAQEGWLTPFEAEELRALNAGFVRDVLAVKKELLATQAARDELNQVAEDRLRIIQRRNDNITALAAELDAAQARADALEAQCAAMREALERVTKQHDDRCASLIERGDMPPFVCDCGRDEARKALQSDAGRGYVRARHRV